MLKTKQPDKPGNELPVLWTQLSCAGHTGRSCEGSLESDRKTGFCNKRKPWLTDAGPGSCESQQGRCRVLTFCQVAAAFGAELALRPFCESLAWCAVGGRDGRVL